MKTQQKQRIEYEENLVKYRNFTRKMFDETPDDKQHKLTSGNVSYYGKKKINCMKGKKIKGSLKMF